MCRRHCDYQGMCGRRCNYHEIMCGGYCQYRDMYEQMRGIHCSNPENGATRQY